MQVTVALYLVDRSAECEKARTTVQQALQAFPAGSVELAIRNLSGRRDHPERTPDDRSIVVVPTLLLLAPERSYLFGDFSVADVVAVLRRAGVSPMPGQHQR